ncbi:MAG: RNA 2',3'-cyclic phosphodiesterase [Desulfobacterales bacterium]|jgi:2'-5' RNA ligase
MPETFRSFIAIDLPKSVRLFLQEIQDNLKSYKLPIKWVRPQNIHLTLKFLGDIETAQTAKIAAAMILAAENCTGVCLTAKDIGVFPDLKRPRVIWAGVKGQLEILETLQRTLDHHLAEIGFPKDRRTFRAHLTLGRVKGKIISARMKTAIAGLKSYESEPFEVDRIVLFKSELRPAGAVYTRVQQALFSGHPETSY